MEGTLIAEQSELPNINIDKLIRLFVELLYLYSQAFLDGQAVTNLKLKYNMKDFEKKGSPITIQAECHIVVIPDWDVVKEIAETIRLFLNILRIKDISSNLKNDAEQAWADLLKICQ